MKKALLYLNYPTEFIGEIKEKLNEKGYEAIHMVPSKDNVDEASLLLSSSEIAILGAGLPLSSLESSKTLKWLHYDWVGVEGGLSKRLFENGVIVTNGSGRNSICLSEHVFYFIFTLSYDTRAIFHSQDKALWGVEREYPYSSLYGKNMLIVGTGSIAQAVAARAKAFGMKTVGYSRTKKEGLDMFDTIYASEDGYEVKDLVMDTDYLVLCTSLNHSSFHMINKDVFKKMKKTAYLINICRGSVVNEEDLAEALTNKDIAGAGCDTFEKEPLSSASPLWNMKNIVITPHSTPQSPLKFIDGTKTIVENIERLSKGQTLLNLQSTEDTMYN